MAYLGLFQPSLAYLVLMVLTFIVVLITTSKINLKFWRVLVLFFGKLGVFSIRTMVPIKRSVAELQPILGLNIFITYVMGMWSLWHLFIVFTIYLNMKWLVFRYIILPPLQNDWWIVDARLVLRWSITQCHKKNTCCAPEFSPIDSKSIFITDHESVVRFA